MVKLYSIVFLILTVILVVVQSKLVCKGENNEDLDWYMVLKYPGSANYFYITSKEKSKWQIPSYALNDVKNMVGVTIQQAYNSKKLNAFYGFYNDEILDVTGKHEGHLKGVVNFDNYTGYWMIHSVPKFPPLKKYNYPQPQMINGQSFFCVSLKTNVLNSVLKQLLVMYAKVQSYFISPNFYQNDELADLVDRFVHDEHAPGVLNSTLILTTLNKIPLIHFGKSRDLLIDLYADYIAPYLKVGLFTETWQKGEALKSNCTGKYKVMNVKEVDINGVIVDEISDHSKWAVSKDQKLPAICIGDINRVKSQFKRGGGSLCISDVSAWKIFSAIVNKYEKC